MKVILLSHTPNPEQIIASAAKLCKTKTQMEKHGNMPARWNFGIKKLRKV